MQDKQMVSNSHLNAEKGGRTLYNVKCSVPNCWIQNSIYFIETVLYSVSIKCAQETHFQVLFILYDQFFIYKRSILR